MSGDPSTNPRRQPRLLGLGTALPEPGVDQREAARLASSRCCHTDAQTRLLPALYRLAGVHHRGSALIDATQPTPATATQPAIGAAVTAPHANNQPDAGLTAPVRQFFPEPVADDPTTHRGPTTAARMTAYARLAPPLAHRAARAALDAAEVEAADLTHLVTVSCTGFRAPGVDLELMRRLDLSPAVQRVNVGFMGCHGALNGLATARALAAAQPGARVLLCCVELCSLHFQYGWDEQQLVANALFADGAAAAVIADGTPPPAAAAPPTPWRVVDTASCLLPDSAEQMTWQIDDHGFIMTLSPQVPQTIVDHVDPWLRRWLESLNLTLGDIDGWAVHPGGPRILAAARQALNLPDDALAASYDILRRHGNMSSPTVLVILQQIQARLPQSARHCVLLSFGPGLTGEAVLLSRDAPVE